MEEITTILAPWYNSIVALIGFAIVRYLYKKVILRILRKVTAI